MSSVRIGASVAFCGFTAEGLMVTATAQNLIQVWQVQSNTSDDSEIVRPPLAVFPTSARMGSPDGVGGQGNIDGRELVIGDESGRLYRFTVGKGLPLPSHVPALVGKSGAGKRAAAEGGNSPGRGNTRGSGRGRASTGRARASERGRGRGRGMRSGVVTVTATKRMVRKKGR